MRVMFLFLILAGGAPAFALADTLVVAPDGSTPWPTIADAVAACSSYGDVIELTDGVFTGPGNVNVLILDKGLTIRSQSDSPAACRINCDAQLGGGTVRAFVIESSQFLNVVWMGGFAIENGYAGQDYGGALLVSGFGRVALLNMAFRGNNASWGGAVGVTGEYAYAGGIDCRFIENTSDTGGGAVYCTDGEVDWTTTLFLNNSTGVMGGACHIAGSGRMDLLSSTFSRNLAGYTGGAIDQAGNDILTITSCTFSGNSATSDAAIHLGTDVQPTLYHTLITGTTAGAGLVSESQGVFLENCTIFGNNGGDWIAPFAAQLALRCNADLDPEYCSEIPDEHENWTLQTDSPCTALNSPCGVQVGAFGANCGDVPTRETSWGALKFEFLR